MEKKFVYAVTMEYAPTGEKAIWAEAFKTDVEAIEFLTETYSCVMDGYVGIPQNGDKNRYTIKPLFIDEEAEETKVDKITPTANRLVAAYRRSLATYDEVQSELRGYLKALQEYGLITEETRIRTMDAFLSDLHEVSLKRQKPYF